MNLIDEVTRLKKLVGRRQAILVRQQDMKTPNYAILERFDIEHDILNAISVLLDVLDLAQAGDEDRLNNVISLARLCGSMSEMPDFDEADIDCLRRYSDIDRKMEENR